MNQSPFHTRRFCDQNIQSGFTLRSPHAFEQGNLALHVCQNPADVLAGRMQFAKETLPLSQWVLAIQQHTATVRRVGASDAGRGALSHEEALPAADALYTTDPDLLIGVFTADCLGIVLTDPTIPLAAVVHSGWKGTAQAILLELLTILKQEQLLNPDHIQVRFAPSLSYSSLEVGPEVIEQIQAMAQSRNLNIAPYIRPGKGDRFYMDNQGINIAMLKSFAIPEENIFPSSIDTKTSPDGFSYRRDGRQCGEHFSFAWIDSTIPTR